MILDQTYQKNYKNWNWIEPNGPEAEQNQHLARVLENLRDQKRRTKKKNLEYNIP